MTFDWITLTDRMGAMSPAPTVDDMEAVLLEVFASDLDEEHSSCSLEAGIEDGPLYTIQIFQSGGAIYTEYSDVDMTEEVVVREFELASREAALDAWLAMIAGRMPAG